MIAIELIYRSPVLLLLYKWFKYIRRVFWTGTSELYRIADYAAKATDGDDRDISPYTVRRVDLCLLHSTKLLVIRRSIEAIQQAHLDTLLPKIYQQKGIKLGSPQATVLHACIGKVYSVFGLINELNERASTDFDPNSKAHETKLLSLWMLLMPDEPLDARVSQKWKDIGFQGLLSHSRLPPFKQARTLRPISEAWGY
ncbi:MAG: hypothetical protein SGCHY_001490 [Lobulomycetales sp.]